MNRVVDRKWGTGLALVAVGLLAGAPASAQETNNGIAVLDIQGTGIDPTLLPTLSEILTVEVDRLGLYRVIGGRDIQSMLGFEKERDVLGCSETSCLSEIGGALGVDRIIVSHVGKVGDTFVVNIKLINIRQANTEGRVYETVSGKQDLLIATVRSSVSKLLGPGSKAAASLVAQPAPAAKPAPSAGAAPPAVAAPAASADAGAQSEPPAYVSPPPGADEGAATAAVETDEPLYKKWWLWTIVGVVVAGGAGAGIAAGVLSSSQSACCSNGGSDGLHITGSIPPP